jgi:pyruvate dehydrogenase E2 component (dihydrolipoamide acetyltransferase)
MATEVILPKLGQTMEEGTIVEWFKQEGDAVQRGEVLFTVESDKATLESESPARGVLRRILAPAGQTVPVLATVAIITRTADEDISAFQVTGQKVADAVAPSETLEPEPPKPEPLATQTDRLFASPRARMRAREHGVNLSQIAGTGPGGRIVERDVFAYIESQPKATPMARKMAADLEVELSTVTGTGIGGKITQEDVEAAAKTRQAIATEPVTAPVPAPAIKLPSVEIAATVPLSGLRGIIAERMSLSVHTTARVTLVTEADATAFVQARTNLKAQVTQEWGFAPGYNDLLALIVARSLREFPYMNARLNGEIIERLTYINLGMAVDTERGLIVPVIRDADTMGLREFGTRFRDLVNRAREGKSLPDELTGGTFTITNLGMYDIDAFTPVINLPEAAILGVGRIQPKPAVRDDKVVVCHMITLSLAFDHRLVDGAPAARFLQHIKRLVENPYLLLG